MGTGLAKPMRVRIPLRKLSMFVTHATQESNDSTPPAGIGLPPIPEEAGILYAAGLIAHGQVWWPFA